MRLRWWAAGIVLLFQTWDVPAVKVQQRFTTDTATISGRVLNRSDDPLASVKVWANLAVVENGRQFFRSGRSGITDTSGRFTFRSLLPGDYYLHIDRGSTHEAFGVYYPGVPGIAQALPIRITENTRETSLNDIQIPEVTLPQISGRVVRAGKTRISFFYTIPQEKRSLPEFARTPALQNESPGEHGEFLLSDMVPGDWFLYPVGMKGERLGRISIHVGNRDITGLSISPDATDIRGNLERESPFPDSNLPAAVDGWTKVSLIPTDGYAHELAISTSVPRSGGKFQFRNVPPGQYEVRTAGTEFIQVGKQRLSGTILTVGLSPISRLTIHVGL